MFGSFHSMSFFVCVNGITCKCNPTSDPLAKKYNIITNIITHIISWRCCKYMFMVTIGFYMFNIMKQKGCVTSVRIVVSFFLFDRFVWPWSLDISHSFFLCLIYFYFFFCLKSKMMIESFSKVDQCLSWSSDNYVKFDYQRVEFVFPIS